MRKYEQVRKCMKMQQKVQKQVQRKLRAASRQLEKVREGQILPHANS